MEPARRLLAWECLAFMTFPSLLAACAILLGLRGFSIWASVSGLMSIATAGQSIFLSTFFDLPIGAPRTSRFPAPPEGAL